MEQIITLIMEYVAIWVPSLVAILGVVSTVLVAMSKTKEALSALKKDETIAELKQAFKNEAETNKQYREEIATLKEEVRKIRYALTKKEAEEE